jgi:hypothetical protein
MLKNHAFGFCYFNKYSKIKIYQSSKFIIISYRLLKKWLQLVQFPETLLCENIISVTSILCVYCFYLIKNRLVGEKL